MEFKLSSEEFTAIFMPIVVYWVYSGIYEMLGSLKWEKYRLHSRREEESKNLVSKKDVIKGVLFQQAIQASVAFAVLKATVRQEVEGQRQSNVDLILSEAGSSTSSSSSSSSSSSIIFFSVAKQFGIAMLVMDTWQYFVHRAMHLNSFLFRNLHSWHHRVVAPYAFAAQYNHPLDGIITETLAGVLAYSISGMSTGTSIIFFSFATVKGIDDHCGLMLPWNPFHVLFSNNTAYHDIHHQLAGNKCNFSQPFFVLWDRILGTHVPYALLNRPTGGFEAKIIANKKNY